MQVDQLWVAGWVGVCIVSILKPNERRPGHPAPPTLEKNCKKPNSISFKGHSGMPLQEGGCLESVGDEVGHVVII